LRDAVEPPVPESATALRSYERIGKSLGSVRRLEIIAVLSGGECAVEEVAKRTGMSVANASQHLRGMFASHLLAVRREGAYAYYRLASDRVHELYEMLQEVATELDPELHAESSWIAIDALAQRMKRRDSDIVVVDVRPEKEFKAGRIRSARNLPLDSFDRRRLDFPNATDVVVYGRSADCLLARSAAEELLRIGLPILRLDGGFSDWKSLGLPVTRSARIR
jgi:rhodanese-related sulfurtransferase/predicted transcriptional regulator